MINKNLFLRILVIGLFSKIIAPHQRPLSAMDCIPEPCRVSVNVPGMDLSNPIPSPVRGRTNTAHAQQGQILAHHPIDQEQQHPLVQAPLPAGLDFIYQECLDPLSRACLEYEGCVYILEPTQIRKRRLNGCMYYKVKNTLIVMYNGRVLETISSLNHKRYKQARPILAVLQRIRQQHLDMQREEDRRRGAVPACPPEFLHNPAFPGHAIGMQAGRPLSRPPLVCKPESGTSQQWSPYQHKQAPTGILDQHNRFGATDFAPHPFM